MARGEVRHGEGRGMVRDVLGVSGEAKQGEGCAGCAMQGSGGSAGAVWGVQRRWPGVGMRRPSAGPIPR